jgi:hypothetical protein
MNKLQTTQNYTTQTNADIQPRLELNSDTMPGRLVRDAKLSVMREQESAPHYLGQAERTNLKIRIHVINQFHRTNVTLRKV